MKNFITFINIGVVCLLGMLLREKTDESNSTETVSNQVVAEAKAPVLTASFASAVGVTDDAATAAKKESNKSDLKSETRDFILNLSESRMMNVEEGKLAEQRATSRSLKDYGSLMVKDQTRMLKDLKVIAATKGLATAKSLGEEKSEGLAELKKEQGDDFDSKFIKMMIIDHKRDVRKLEKAANSKDADVQVFATLYLPVVKSHLEKLQSIKKSN